MANIKNSEYWRARFVEQQVLMLEDGQRFYEHLERQYNAAINEIQNDIDTWYRRFADNNEISYADAKKLLTSRELEEFHWSVEEYIKHGQENAVSGQWVKQLENASARVHISRLESLQLQMQQHVEVLFANQLDGMDKAMRGILTESYYHTAYEIQKGIGVGWDVQGLDTRRLDTIIRKPWAPDGSNFSEKVWRNRNTLANHLETDFTRSLIRGDGPDKAINDLNEEMNRSKHAAGRLVMTESAYFSSAGQKECFKELGVERYQIVATLDNDTSDICRSMDGVVFPMIDYEPAVTANPFHPWCRTVTAPYFDDEYGERAARDSDGKVYYVPSSMKYGEWRKRQNEVIEKSAFERYNKGIRILPSQFGKKAGKHASDFGLSPNDADSRKALESIIHDIVDTRDRVVPGMWRGQGKVLVDGNRASGPVDFIIKGDDVVVAKDGEFITILKNGITNGSVKKALKEAGK